MRLPSEGMLNIKESEKMNRTRSPEVPVSETWKNTVCLVLVLQGLVGPEYVEEELRCVCPWYCC